VSRRAYVFRVTLVVFVVHFGRQLKLLDQHAACLRYGTQWDRYSCLLSCVRFCQPVEPVLGTKVKLSKVADVAARTLEVGRMAWASTFTIINVDLTSRIDIV
jgi:hypothetical protein